MDFILLFGESACVKTRWLFCSWPVFILRSFPGFHSKSNATLAHLVWAKTRGSALRPLVQGAANDIHFTLARLAARNGGRLGRVLFRNQREIVPRVDL